MPRDGNILFSDIEGRLEVLEVRCENPAGGCTRHGRYHVTKLIARYGRDAIRNFTDDLARLSETSRRHHCPVHALFEGGGARIE